MHRSSRRTARQRNIPTLNPPKSGRTGVEPIWSDFPRRVRGLPTEKKALIFAKVLMAGLVAYRVYSYLVTGFFVSDEFGYYFNAANGTIYGDRWFFGWLNLLIFDVFNIRSPDGFAYLLPFYLFLWSGLTIYVFYRLLKLLGFTGPAVALSVLTSLVLVSFILLSLGFLTETLGLCMAMLGTYSILRFSKSDGGRQRVAWLILGALFLGFAGGTREPYVALEIGAVGAVAITSLRRGAAGVKNPKGVAAVSILIFLLPTGLMLYANTATTSTVLPLTSGIIESILTPANPGPSVTTILIAHNVTETVLQNSTTVTITTQSITTISTSTVSTSTSAPVYPFFAKSIPFNTVVIFFGGIFLGWGPIAFRIALIGFVILSKRSLRRDPTSIAIFILVLSALASDLAVSFLFAPDPTYFTFTNYSTIIRFSGTALPAFFLTAPFFLAVVARRKRRVMGLVAVVGVALLVVVPAYQVFAISNLGYTTVNPFGLGYRSPAVQVRDYVNAHPADAPFHVIGVPYGWYFTPGIDQLKSVDVYSPRAEHTLSPALNYSAFLSKHWTEFYVYSSTNFISERSNSPYLLQFIPGAPVPPTSEPVPFSILNATTVIRNPDFLLTKVDLSWQAAGP